MTRALEIERRFLLKRVPKGVKDSDDILHIKQYYINSKDGLIRARHTYDTVSNEDTFDVTKKQYISHGVCDEAITPIEHSTFSDLIEGAHKFVSKTRMKVELPSGLVWEIDKFHKPLRLVMAEIELPSIDHEIILPPFIQDNLIMEVTGIKEFSNYGIALEV